MRQELIIQDLFYLFFDNINLLLEIRNPNFDPFP